MFSSNHVLYSNILQTSTELPDVWRIFLPAILLSKGQMGSKFGYIWHWSKPFWESNDFRIHGPYRIDLFLVKVFLISIGNVQWFLGHLGTISIHHPVIDVDTWSVPFTSKVQFLCLRPFRLSQGRPVAWGKKLHPEKVARLEDKNSRFRIQQKTMVFQTFRKWIFQLPCLLVFVFI